MRDPITPEQAAAILNITAHGVRSAIRDGRLKAQRFGSSDRPFYLIERADLARIKRGTPGRKKQAG